MDRVDFTEESILPKSRFYRRVDFTEAALGDFQIRIDFLGAR